VTIKDDGLRYLDGIIIQVEAIKNHVETIPDGKPTTAEEARDRANTWKAVDEHVELVMDDPRTSHIDHRRTPTRAAYVKADTLARALSDVRQWEDVLSDDDMGERWIPPGGM